MLCSLSHVVSLHKCKQRQVQVSTYWRVSLDKCLEAKTYRTVSLQGQSHSLSRKTHGHSVSTCPCLSSVHHVPASQVSTLCLHIPASQVSTCPYMSLPLKSKTQSKDRWHTLSLHVCIPQSLSRHVHFSTTLNLYKSCRISKSAQHTGEKGRGKETRPAEGARRRRRSGCLPTAAPWVASASASISSDARHPRPLSPFRNGLPKLDLFRLCLSSFVMTCWCNSICCTCARHRPRMQSHECNLTNGMSPRLKGRDALNNRLLSTTGCSQQQVLSTTGCSKRLSKRILSPFLF